ncbi:2-aminoethylphosphonate--pyruvate transaminase [Fusibacter paucivorans]|uniref:2-aminoethylphosphonate--pyruvate transaminase n=2 Tax=Fusibacter paucivorans TaxID=76009 RepID=A0ABS5PS96_9FIRM|nr:2-aminoethylphosphonate--pyruvate transaminase [Fusibacter paucivorans]MBS7526937.1 2-aminoethylphosphonate--pyruvate transaminase [Fusibacter paucivorans]
MYSDKTDNAYILLTPGPLTTSKTVKEAMLIDWCTWDQAYNAMVQSVREKLVALAVKKAERRTDYTSVLMQGSGTFSVEAVLGTVIPDDGKLLVISNGAYGQRIKNIADRLNIHNVMLAFDETKIPDVNKLAETLESDQAITHVAVVHCETTSGILNPVESISGIVKQYDKTLIVDAMSSFGGMAIDVDELQIDYLVSSANKCIQGVPGFAFVIARTEMLNSCEGQARSLSLDLFSQWREMEEIGGKWRFTSPTHTVYAFHQALIELEEEGGVNARYARYCKNQSVLSEGMAKLGFETMINKQHQSPFITSFYYPEHFDFHQFYNRLKAQGFIIYPGKISKCDSFRMGNIGEIYENDIHRLLKAVAAAITE